MMAMYLLFLYGTLALAPFVAAPEAKAAIFLMAEDFSEFCPSCQMSYALDVLVHEEPLSSFVPFHWQVLPLGNSMTDPSYLQPGVPEQTFNSQEAPQVSPRLAIMLIKSKSISACSVTSVNGSYPPKYENVARATSRKHTPIAKSRHNPARRVRKQAFRASIASLGSTAMQYC